MNSIYLQEGGEPSNGIKRHLTSKQTGIAGRLLFLWRNLQHLVASKSFTYIWAVVSLIKNLLRPHVSFGHGSGNESLDTAEQKPQCSSEPSGGSSTPKRECTPTTACSLLPQFLSSATQTDSGHGGGLHAADAPSPAGRSPLASASVSSVSQSQDVRVLSSVLSSSDTQPADGSVAKTSPYIGLEKAAASHQVPVTATMSNPSSHTSLLEVLPTHTINRYDRNIVL